MATAVGTQRAATAARVQRLESGGWFKYALLLPAVLWVVAFTFFPLISVVRYSVSSYVLGQGITGFVGLANYADVLTSADFWHSIWVTLIYVAVSVPIELVLGFLAAWLINLGAPGSRVFSTIIGSPLFTLEVAIGYLGVTFFSVQGGLIAVPLAALGIDIPWMSTAWGGITGAIILDVWRWTSFIFIIVLAGLAGIPSDLYDAAVLDARSHWQVMWNLALPLAWPVVTIAVLLRMVECLKVFAIPFALTSGGPGISTQTFSAMDYLTTIQFFDFGKGSAMGIIFLILVSVVISLFFKQMRKSLA
jgi:multiple sugar transport system permease protein